MDTKDLDIYLDFLKRMLARKLSPRQAYELILSQKQGTICNGDMIRNLRVGTAIVSNDINRLESLGLITQAPIPKEPDKRKKGYSLTRRGRETVIALVT